MAARTLADFDTFAGWKPVTPEAENMRDILNSSKGRTQSQRDYSRDAGDYVPLLERRNVFSPSYLGDAEPELPRGWNSSALATAQEFDAANARYLRDDDGSVHIARNTRIV